MAQTSIDKWNLETFDTIVSNIGHQIDVINIKLTIFSSFGINSSENLYLVFIEVLSRFLNHPDVSEELSTEVTVSYNRFLDHTEVSIDKLNDFILWTHLAISTLVQLVRKTLQL